MCLTIKSLTSHYHYIISPTVLFKLFSHINLNPGLNCWQFFSKDNSVLAVLILTQKTRSNGMSYNMVEPKFRSLRKPYRYKTLTFDSIGHN